MTFDTAIPDFLESVIINVLSRKLTSYNYNASGLQMSLLDAFCVEYDPTISIIVDIMCLLELFPLLRCTIA